jgi:hypothetical protein
MQAGLLTLWLLNSVSAASPVCGLFRAVTATLNFITTLATMVLGYFAGTWLRAASKGTSEQAVSHEKISCHLGAGCLVASGLMHYREEFAL